MNSFYQEKTEATVRVLFSTLTYFTYCLYLLSFRANIYASGMFYLELKINFVQMHNASLNESVRSICLFTIVI